MCTRGHTAPPARTNRCIYICPLALFACMQIDRPPPRRSIDRAFRSIALHTRTRTRTYVRTHACSETATATAIEFAMQKVTLASVHRITVHVIRLQSCSVPAGKSLLYGIIMVCLQLNRRMHASMHGTAHPHMYVLGHVAYYVHACNHDAMSSCLRIGHYIILGHPLGRKVPVRFVSCDRRSL